MIPKTDQELYVMGWSGLDVYLTTLNDALVSETLAISDIINTRKEIDRVIAMMERVG